MVVLLLVLLLFGVLGWGSLPVSVPEPHAPNPNPNSDLHVHDRVRGQGVLLPCGV